MPWFEVVETCQLERVYIVRADNLNDALESYAVEGKLVSEEEGDLIPDKCEESEIDEATLHAKWAITPDEEEA